MPYVEVNDVQLHYREEGNGEPLVWVMGTGMNGDAWHRYQVPHFRDRYRCITYDLRGAGRSDCPDQEYTPKVLAADLAALTEHLDIQDAHFAGFSLGSCTIQELALAHPNLVRTAILISTWSATRIEHHVRRHYESRLYALQHSDMDVFRRFAFWMWSPTLVDEEYDKICALEEFLATVSGAKDVSGYIGHFQADIVHDTIDRLPGISCPTLVVHGDEDLITRPAYNRRVAAAIPGSKLVEVPRGGHLAYLEQPEAINTAIDEFLKSC